jgi:hypothetical protein
MSKINPNFEAQVLTTAETNIAALEAASNITSESDSPLAKRVSYQSHFCCADWGGRVCDYVMMRLQGANVGVVFNTADLEYRDKGAELGGC